MLRTEDEDTILAQLYPRCDPCWGEQRGTEQLIRDYSGEISDLVTANAPLPHEMAGFVTSPHEEECDYCMRIHNIRADLKPINENRN